ncbi:MAG: hypothetical protein HY433_03335 [Candidatus Liptonbacteria bacterium]|nr:hypothetical protein [Candidatus Liptonbacteria bacterium]
MNTVTIPKRITQGEELVVIPRKEYEEYLQLRKIIPVVKMTSAQKRDLEQARKDYKQGKYMTLEQLEHELGIARKR